MKFAFVLYFLYVGVLIAFVWQHPSDISAEVCIFLGLFGAWFSRMMWHLEHINTTLLARESMHQLILQEHEHFQKLWSERFYNTETNPAMLVFSPQNSHRAWSQGEPSLESDNPWSL